MSETSTLISCTGKITRAELAQMPTPPATNTHIPILHIAVVETLVETLSHRHIGIMGEEFAVSKDGMEMFGVLDLETSFDGCRFAIGIRNANINRATSSWTSEASEAPGIIILTSHDVHQPVAGLITSDFDCLAPSACACWSVRILRFRATTARSLQNTRRSSR